MDEKKLVFYGVNNIKENKNAKKHLSEEDIQRLAVLSKIIPFRANNFILDELIDWERNIEDPIFKIVFPSKEILYSDAMECMRNAQARCGNEDNKKVHAYDISLGETDSDDDTPEIDGEKIFGTQHKYEQTFVYFPIQGQQCFAYCNYCFRWNRFTEKCYGVDATENKLLHDYLSKHKEISDVLITGGDPLIMPDNILKKHLDRFLAYENIENIRIGTKSISFWPYRFLGEEGRRIANIFKGIKKAGKNITLILNINHYKELENKIVVQAIEKLQKLGIVLRTQTPIIKNINDKSEILIKTFRKQANTGMVPYYLFALRPTGTSKYYRIPIEKIFSEYIKAYRELSGLCKTIRGPVLSTKWGKLIIENICMHKNSKKFILKFINSKEKWKMGKVYYADCALNRYWINAIEDA